METIGVAQQVVMTAIADDNNNNNPLINSYF